jgi:hypothetical protein
MRSGIARHVRGNAVAYLALALALSGTAYAAGKIGSKDIKAGAVKSKQIADDGIKSKDLNKKALAIRLNVPPTSWVSAGIPDAEVTYFVGSARVEKGGGAGTFRNVYANVQIPNQIGGRRMQLKSFQVCYGAAATAVLDEVTVRTIKSTSTTPFADTTVISDGTDRSDAGCRKYKPTDAVVLGPSEFIEPALSLSFGGGQFSIHRTTVVLQPR